MKRSRNKRLMFSFVNDLNQLIRVGRQIQTNSYKAKVLLHHIKWERIKQILFVCSSLV